MAIRRICPHCGGAETYLDYVPENRMMAMYCRICGWTNDHTVTRARIATGQDPLTGKVLDFR